jgi:excisionase family DNA binding protein
MLSNAARQMEESTEDEDLWTTRRTMRYLGVKREKLKNLMRLRDLPYKRFGNEYRFIPEQVKSWVNAQEEEV